MTANGSGPVSAATESEARGFDQLGGLIGPEDNAVPDSAQAFPLGFVYFLEQPPLGRIKIGSTCNPISRLKCLAAQMPEPAVVLGVIPGGASEEMRWHKRWAALRIHREWFAADDQLRVAIATACRAAEAVA